MIRPPSSPQSRLPTTHTVVPDVRVEHRERRTRQPQRMTALPSSYSPAAAATPVDGVAIVGCQLNRTPEEREAEFANVLAVLETLEPVLPLRQSASPYPEDLVTGVADDDDDDVSPDSFRFVGSSSFAQCGAPSPFYNSIAGNNAGDENTSSSDESVASATETKPDSAQWADEDQPFSRSLLNKGYILFSDAFINDLNNRHFDALTQQFRETLPTDEPALHVDPLQSARQQRLAEACHYLALGETECRPLFRRREAAEVYGEAAYIKASTA